MHRIDGPGATVDHKFTDGDPVGGVQATIVTDDWLNDVQEELISVLTDGGIAPVKGTQDQLLKAIKAIGRSPATLGTAGELKIPVVVGGVSRTFILKWGQASGASTYSITFPSAFPTACLWAGGFSNGGGGSAAAFCEVGIFSASTLPLYTLQSGGVGSSQAQLRAVLWVAIGW